MKKHLLFLCASALAVQVSAQTVQTFNYTGAVQTFTVPSCVYSIIVDARGAKGGNKDSTCIGGLGGQVNCTLSVTPGEVLEIYVGGMGTDGDNVTGVIPGGFNGGGTGYDDTDNWGGGGGGGASDIRRTPYSLNDRVIVAGGGGGGGIDGCSSANRLDGGAGGGLTGGNGEPSPSSCVGSGQGGTQTAGGLKGQYTGCNNNSTDGTFGMGGVGFGNCSNSDDGGSGGGGGYYGGGGGNFGAGGGGSSYTDGSCTGVVHTQGVQNGNGIITITYAGGGPPVTYVQNPTQMCVNWPVQTLSAGTPSGGTYSGPGVSGNTFNPATAGVGVHTINYIYTDTSGCSDTASQQITVLTCTGINPVSSAMNLRIFPNPFSTEISIYDIPSGTHEVKMFNALGELIFEKKINTGSCRIETGSYPNGIYFLQVNGPGGTFTKKVVKGN